MNLMPRKSLPEYLLQKASSELPKLCLLENPLHLSHCGRRAILMKADLLKILARKEFTKIATRDNSISYINTILGQRSLLPVSNYCIPKISSYESSLDLFILPEFLILCDNLCSTELAENRPGCDIFTVGSISRSQTFLDINFKTGTCRTVSKETLTSHK